MPLGNCFHKPSTILMRSTKLNQLSSKTLSLFRPCYFIAVGGGLISHNLALSSDVKFANFVQHKEMNLIFSTTFDIEQTSPLKTNSFLEVQIVQRMAAKQMPPLVL